MAKITLADFDHPLIFSLAVALVVLFWFGLFGWIFTKFNLTGPLSAVKGGVM